MLTGTTDSLVKQIRMQLLKGIPLQPMLHANSTLSPSAGPKGMSIVSRNGTKASTLPARDVPKQGMAGTLLAQGVPTQDVGRHAARRGGPHQQAGRCAPQAAAPGATQAAPGPLRMPRAGPGRRHSGHSAGRPMRLAGKPAAQPPAQPITNCNLASARGVCKLGSQSLHTSSLLQPSGLAKALQNCAVSVMYGTVQVSS